VGSPDHWREDHYKQEKEHAGDFEPDDSAYAGKGTKESSHASRHAARHLSSGATGILCVRRTRLRVLGWLCGGLGCSLRLTSKLLSRHAPGKAKANSRDAPYLFRLHSDLMVTV
jgi:hypothetical protein